MVEKIEAALTGSDWLVGGGYCVADMNAFALTYTLPRLLPEAVNEKETPRMTTWLNRIHERPAVKKALAMGKRGAAEDIYGPPG